jgi:ribose transport system permease protein
MTSLKSVGIRLLEQRLWVILLVTLVLGFVMVPGFMSVRTLAFSLDRASTAGIVAVGMTVVLIAAKIDLSSGSVLALCGIVAIDLQPTLGPWGAVGVAILAGGVAGVLNGFLIVGLGIDSMIATLGTMLAIRSLAHVLTSSQPVTGPDWEFGANVTGNVLGPFSSRVILFLVLIVILQVWLSRTPSGRELYAVGSNSTAARDSGIRTNVYVFGAFILVGLCAGLAGVLLSLNVNTGSPVFGDTIVLASISAVVMGGTRLEGGRGSAWGTLGGVITLGALTTVLEYASVPAYIQQIVTGGILILLIVMDRIVYRAQERDERRTITHRTTVGTRPGSEES